MLLSKGFLRGFRMVFWNRGSFLSRVFRVADWAFTDPQSLNPDSLFQLLSLQFGANSEFCKMSENLLQVICGKRAECIENRRDLLLSELKNPNVKSALRRIPPCPRYLFNKEQLQPLVTCLGGSQVWLNTPSYVENRRPSSRKENERPRSSARGPQSSGRSHHSRGPAPFHQSNQKPKVDSKKDQSKSKGVNSFRPTKEK